MKNTAKARGAGARHRIVAEKSYHDFLATQRAALDDISDSNKFDFAWGVMIALRAGVPPSSVATILGVSQSSVGRWATGKNLPPNDFVRAAYFKGVKDAFDSFIGAAQKWIDPTLPDKSDAASHKRSNSD